MRLRIALVALALAFAGLAGGVAQAADDYTVKDSTGATITIRAKEVASKKLTTHTLADSAGTLIDPATATKQDTGNTSLSSIDAKLVAPYAATITASITRPADTTAYAVNDTWADSTASPTTGGFTLTGACRTSGADGLLQGLAIVSSNDPATTLQGELWLFDSAVTAVNDNAAYALSDTDAVKLVPAGVIPFTLATSQAGAGANSVYSAANLNVPYRCSGSANLRFLVKVKNAYTPASGEVLTVRAAVMGLD
jgi:hypothetical protein